METVLIVDDDTRLLKMLQRTLTYEGFDVATAPDGQVALPDVIILDWMLPEMDGIDVLESLREARNETPILMLTARDAVGDRVHGLERGADDYLIKPFAPRELVARVNALLRRSTAGTQAPLSFADLSLDPVSRVARRGERTFTLTPTEYDLLHLLLCHPRQVLTRRQILVHVWGHNFEGDDNVLQVYVSYLRKKTEAGGESRLIQTVRGVGYVLWEDEARSSDCG